MAWWIFPEPELANQNDAKDLRQKARPWSRQ
jgi:hypothetical protein